MSTPVALLAPTVRMASVLAAVAGEKLPGTTLVSFTLGRYLRAENPPRRVVLCPAGRSVARDLAFLRAVSARLLWPAPPAKVAEAIDGIRAGEDAPFVANAMRRRRERGRSGPALLLEGAVGAARARAALEGSRTREWIVESAGRVRLSERSLARFAAAGVRWSVLAPVVVDGVCASRDLARARRSWRALLPPRTPVWIRDRGERTPRKRRSR